MKNGLAMGELIVLLAGICWLVSLPLLARGSSLLWFAAQGLYFIGVIGIAWRYLGHYVRD